MLSSIYFYILYLRCPPIVFIISILFYFYDFNESTTSSVQKGLHQQTFYSFTIKILKASILTKYKLQQLFDEVDALKDTLEADKLQYQTQSIIQGFSTRGRRTAY